MIVHGISQTRAALALVEAKIKTAAPTAARAGAEVVGRNMISRAPRDTGATAASIRVDSGGETAQVGPTTSYARFPEFGTRYIPAQRFMRDAADASESEVVAAQIAVYRAAL
jgi:HK97 gp10 family phage protein